MLAVADSGFFLPLLMRIQQANRLGAGDLVHRSGRTALQVVAQATGSVQQRQQITGSLGGVGQHPAQQLRIDRLALLDQSFTNIRVNIELEREEGVVVLREGAREASWRWTWV